MRKISIRILDKGLNLLAEIDDYESLIFIRRFYKVGEFELKININKRHTDKLLENNLILLGSSRNKVGIIMHRECSSDESGSDTLFIKGCSLKGIANRRIIVPTEKDGYTSISGSQETILKHFVNANIVNPTEPQRSIENVIVNKDLERGKIDKWRGRYEVLADKLSEIGEYAELGWDFTVDTKNRKIVFDVMVGRDLTTKQRTLPPVIFSKEFDNIDSRNYIESIINSSNVIYAGGKGEEESRLVLQKGNQTGFERIETFGDCSNAEDAIELGTLAEQKLEELKKIQTFEVKVLQNNSFKYEEDYDLGDIVTVQDRKLGITMDSRIVEIKEIQDVNGFEIEATFGTNIPTMSEKLKRDTKKIVR